MKKTRLIKEMVKEIGSDLESLASESKDITVSVIKETSRAVGYFGIKSLYPVLGNLSKNLQNRIEKKLGNEVYNSRNATLSSIATNFLGYPMGTLVASHFFIDDPNNKPIHLFFLTALAFGYGEALIRAKLSTEEGKPPHTYIKDRPEPIASFLGKIISLPFDYVFDVYDRVTTRLWKDIREEK